MQTQVDAETDRRSNSGDSYVRLSGISWECLKGIAERDGGGRITFEDGEIEIISPGRRHEKHRHALAEFVEIACEALGIDLVALGSTTLFGDDARRAIEPDEAFVLDPAKLAAVEALDAAGEDDMARYPSPDLVIEIDMRSPARDRLAVYSAIAVVEVWEFDGETLSILRRDADGRQRYGHRAKRMAPRLSEATRRVFRRRSPTQARCQAEVAPRVCGEDRLKRVSPAG